MTRLVLATHNAHKVVELRRILGHRLAGIELVGYDGPEPIEDGTTFAENALIKARAAFAHTGLPSLADDSGISVAALNGAPGIHSARFAGTRDDADNRRLLIERLDGVTEREAEFVCAAAFVAEGFEHVELGRWPGVVGHAERGSGGFGYDPLFVPADGDGRSAAELSADEKDATSHRTRAFTALLDAVGDRLR